MLKNWKSSRRLPFRPLPLALKDAGVYHTIAKVGTQYELIGEPLPLESHCPPRTRVRFARRVQRQPFGPGPMGLAKLFAP